MRRAAYLGRDEHIVEHHRGKGVERVDEAYAIRRYQQAAALRDGGDYAGAIALLEMGGTPRSEDAQQLYYECNYELAMDAITDHTYAGTVSKISQIGTATSGVTVYDVTLTIEGDDQLKLGMNGTATILVEERENVLLVPIAALNTSRGESYVWLKSDSAADGEPGVRTTVETGLSDENYAQVLSGLDEGDVVLITREASSSSTDSRDGGFDFGSMSFDMGSMPSGGDMPSGGFPGGGGGSGNGGGRSGNR